MRSHQPGFTLLEVLVALGIASVVAAIGYNTLGVLVDNSERHASRPETWRAAAVRRALSDWLRSARIEPGADASAFRGLDGIDVLPIDELYFQTSARTPVGEGVALVRVYVDADSTTTERGLVAVFGRGDGHTREQTLVLDSTIVGLDARYRSVLFAGGRWLPSWVSSSMLPDMVEITFSATEQTDALLRLPMLISVGAGK